MTDTVTINGTDYVPAILAGFGFGVIVYMICKGLDTSDYTRGLSVGVAQMLVFTMIFDIRKM